jgi:phage baseplate assembly protein W
MSSLAKDLDPNIYIGLQLPLKPSNNITFFSSTQTYLEQAKYSAANLLKTMKGERVGQPNFGSNLHNLLFEQYNDVEEFTERVKTEITEDFNTWLPYVNLDDTKIFQDNNNPNLLYVTLTISLKYNPQDSEEVTVSFGGASTVSSVGVGGGGATGGGGY